MASFRLEDLEVYAKAVAADADIFALLRRSNFQHDLRLKAQISDAASSVPSNIAEGHGQQTDRGFAHYLYISRGSAKEVRARLLSAMHRGYVRRTDCETYDKRYEEILKMLWGLIRHLEKENRKHRGSRQD